MIGPAAHKNVTSDSAVKAAGGQLVAVALTGSGAAATLVLYDNPGAASGTVLLTIKAADGATEFFSPAIPYVFTAGCYADITGSGASATVVFI